MSVHEELSRLLEGDLPEAEARALSARIAADPELAAAWVRLSSLAAELRAALPVAPPPELDAQVLDHLSGQAPRRTRWLALAALAAAVLLVTTWPRSPSELVLTEGVANVDGRARVLAVDAVIDVDGEARISVEPIGDLDRGTLSGGETMTSGRRTFPAGPGLVVTVVVLGGTATVRAADPPPAAVAPPAPVADPAADPAALDLAAENALLRKLLADQEAELRGTPVPWPPGLVEALTPAGFEARVREAVSECVPEVRLVGVECTEPPCLALLRAPRGQSPYGKGRTWYDDLVNECAAWTDAYTNGVVWASGAVECADGTTDQYQVLGWSTSLAPDQFPAAERENLSKRFETRIEEIRRGWTCD